MAQALRDSASLVFVLMPFRPQFMTINTSSISPAVQSYSLDPRLAPNIQESRDIMSNIYRGIWESRFVVADLTGLNPNVFFELGIASTLNKPSILLSQNVNELPFDLRRDRVLEYRDDEEGRAKLRTDLSAQISEMLRKDWSSVPSWKGTLNVDLLPVSALLSIEVSVAKEVWIIEPEESFQDTSFYKVIIANMERGVLYKFIVGDHPDIEQAFKVALQTFYGTRAQVLYVPEDRLQIPLSLAIFDPTSPNERGYQYLPDGITVCDIPMTRPLLTRARRLFISMWQTADFRLVGERLLGKA